jgi:predicted transcriptional regulator
MAEKPMAAISTRIPAPLVDRLGKLAAKMDRPMSWCIRSAVEDWVKKQERKQR